MTSTDYDGFETFRNAFSKRSSDLIDGSFKWRYKLRRGELLHVADLLKDEGKHFRNNNMTYFVINDSICRIKYGELYYGAIKIPIPEHCSFFITEAGNLSIDGMSEQEYALFRLGVP